MPEIYVIRNDKFKQKIWNMWAEGMNFRVDKPFLIKYNKHIE